MTESEAAQRFLEQLRVQTRLALGTPPVQLNESHASAAVELILSESTLEDQRDPRFRARLEQEALRAINGNDEYMSGILTEMQGHIAAIAASRISGSGTARHVHVGHLETGQLNAVSMLVPGHADAYLVVFEDQLWGFARHLSNVVAQAIPGHEASDGRIALGLDRDDIAERLNSDEEISNFFGGVILDYVVKGRFVPFTRQLQPAHRNFALMLQAALEYFVLAHEYGHVILGHPKQAARSRAVLPISDVEVLAYSWRMERDADLIGMLLALPASVEYRGYPLPIAFMGISLFFDALDVIDRAVALLETGDENIIQVGSHPPNALRIKYLRDNLPHFAEAQPSLTEDVKTALEMAEIQRKAIDMLWEKIRPVFAGLRRHAGVRAHPKWRTFRTDTEPFPS